MSSTNDNPSPGRGDSSGGPGGFPGDFPGDFEDTLRLIARLPAPDGLEERVQAGVRAKALAAPRKGRVLEWPAALRPGSEWMRGAAAAAIVFVVVGGGWGVYSRVQPPQPARVIVMPPRMGAPGGFSGANAIRTPNTLKGPLVPHAAAAPAAQAGTGTQTRTGARTKPRAKRRGLHSGAGSAQQAAPAAK
jgi:hypothetical protein